jgi:diacylglycerol kinase (ATP)
LRILLVFNPSAAGGRAGRLAAAVVGAFEHFARVDVVQTTGAGDAVSRVAAANLSDYNALVAAGGDGTLFEVLNGLYSHAGPQRIPLGLVPVGTGNAFARDLGLMPGDWKQAVQLVRAGHLRRVDVGRVETAAESYYFLNIVGTGLPVDAMKTSAKLKFMGRSAYTLATLWHAMRLESYPLVLELDGQQVQQESLFVEVSNTRYTGTSFLIAPAAQLDDGLLDITLLGRLSRLRLLRLFPTIYQGGHVRYPEITTLRAREIRIVAPAGLILAPDGELRGSTPATISCLPRDLEIFAPA